MQIGEGRPDSHGRVLQADIEPSVIVQSHAQHVVLVAPLATVTS
jgi:hypothetical protein